MNILFICSMARLRSKTAAHTLSSANHPVDYAGLDSDADKPLTKDQVEWADIIVCMEMAHRSKIRRKHKGLSHKIQVWNIEDIYPYMDDTLVTLLKGRYEKLIMPLLG